MKVTPASILCGLLLTFVGACAEEEAPSAPQKPASVLDYAPAAPTAPATPIAKPTPPPPATEQIKAEVGVGKKGRGYGGGIITEPAHQFFAIKERIAFEVEIPHALELYKAEHDGKGPKTHEAFMRDIIEFNSIKLPELPDGHRYVYDPKEAQMMVEIPANAAPSQP
jgi:hypothetical protein